MRVMVIGATGAIGTPLIAQLHERGHQVIGTSRSTSKFEQLHALGAQPIVLDAAYGEVADHLHRSLGAVT